MVPSGVFVTSPTGADLERALPYPPRGKRRAYARACRTARAAEVLDAKGAPLAERQRLHTLLCAYWAAYDQAATA